MLMVIAGLLTPPEAQAFATGPTALFNSLSKTRSNLLWMWARP